MEQARQTVTLTESSSAVALKQIRGGKCRQCEGPTGIAHETSRSIIYAAFCSTTCGERYDAEARERERREYEQRKRQKAEAWERRKVQARAERQENILEILRWCGVPPRYRPFEFSTFPNTRPSADLTRGGVLLGERGRGKTGWAISIVRDLILKGVHLDEEPPHTIYDPDDELSRRSPDPPGWTTDPANPDRISDRFRFIRAVDLTKRIRATYANDARETEPGVTRLFGKEINFLVVDDLGKERGTPHDIEKLYDVLDARYVHELPTLVTTNFTLDGLAGRYGPDVGPALASRLADFGPVWRVGGDQDFRLDA